jgi:hypothetical protein
MIVHWLELTLGLIIWPVVLWDGFATVVLPRTVAPMSRLSGRFNRLSWRLWASIASLISNPKMRLSYLATYGPISIVGLLILWAGLLIVAFALVFDGSGIRFQSNSRTVDFGTLLYLSGSTFLTLGIGDITPLDAIGQVVVILEVATGYIFLGLMITYMPILNQAYGSREVGNLLIHSRAGSPPSPFSFLRRYAGADHSEILRGNLRDAERWMADIQQSHLAHPVLAFYRAHHLGESWLISVATILDSCALLMVGGAGLPAAQAALTYQMGARLLEDLTEALGLSVGPQCQGRLTELDLSAMVESTEQTLILPPGSTGELFRIVRQYDVNLVTLAKWLVITLPHFIAPSNMDARS